MRIDLRLWVVLHVSANRELQFCLFYLQPQPLTSQTTVSTLLRASDDTSALSSATKMKFEYRRLFGSRPKSSRQPSTVLIRSCMLSKFIENLCCTSCGCSTLAVSVVNCNHGLVCSLETHCTCCTDMISKIHISDRVGVKSGSNVPFVMTRSAVSATMGMEWGIAVLSSCVVILT